MRNVCMFKMFPKNECRHNYLSSQMYLFNNYLAHIKFYLPFINTNLLGIKKDLPCKILISAA